MDFFDDTPLPVEGAKEKFYEGQQHKKDKNEKETKNNEKKDHKEKKKKTKKEKKEKEKKEKQEKKEQEEEKKQQGTNATNNEDKAALKQKSDAAKERLDQRLEKRKCELRAKYRKTDDEATRSSIMVEHEKIEQQQKELATGAAIAKAKPAAKTPPASTNYKRLAEDTVKKKPAAKTPPATALTNGLPRCVLPRLVKKELGPNFRGPSTPKRGSVWPWSVPASCQKRGPWMTWGINTQWCGRQKATRTSSA